MLTSGRGIGLIIILGSVLVSVVSPEPVVAGELIVIPEPNVYIQDSAGRNTTEARIGDDLTIWIEVENWGDATSPPLMIDVCIRGHYRVGGNVEEKAPCLRILNISIPPDWTFALHRPWNTMANFTSLEYYVIEGQTYDIHVLWEPEDEGLKNSNNSGFQYVFDALTITDESGPDNTISPFIVLGVPIICIAAIAVAIYALKKKRAE